MKGLFRSLLSLAALTWRSARAALGFAFAQGGYFGRNKVQYRKFDFKVLKTDHFDIYYYPEEEAAAKMASRMAERWYTRLSQLLNHELSSRQPLILYASGAHFRQTNADRRGARRGHRRRDRGLQAPDRPAVCRARSRRATTCSATSSCTRSSTTSRGTNVSSGIGRRAGPAAVVHRGDGRVPVDRPGGSARRRCGCARRRGARSCRRSTSSTTRSTSRIATARRCGPTSPASTATRVVGNMLRAASGRDATYQHGHRVGAADRHEDSCRREWHDAEFEAFRPIAEATKMPAAFARPLIAQGQDRRRPERRARAEPGRLARSSTSPRTRPVLDRPLPRRRAHRRGHPEDHQHRDERPLREPVVPDLGRAPGIRPASGSCSPAIVEGRADADDRRRRARPDRARDSLEARCTRSSTRPGRPTASRSRSRR